MPKANRLCILAFAAVLSGSAALLAQTKFSYLAGPNGCTATEGYPDAAICTVPDERPPGKFAPPKAGQSYVDSNFGAKVRVLSSPRSLHGYGSPSAISANNRYALVSLDDATTVVDFS